MNERESVNVCFRKFDDGDVIAFIGGYECNPGWIMSYMHIGQHSEASIEFMEVLNLCTPDEFKALLDELESIGYDVTVVENL